MQQEEPRWEERLRKLTLVITRLGLAYLFFANIWWKMPPAYGCGDAFTFPVLTAEGKVDTSNSGGGLCYWLGLESAYASRTRTVFVTDLRPVGGPRLGVNIAPLAQINALIIDNVIKPYLGVTGFLIWAAEVFIALSLFLGLFTRLGALVAIAISVQLFVGLANIPSPYEWEWSYGQMVLLSLVMLGLAPGRIWGIDAWLRRRFAQAKGWPARLVMAFT
ncbi:MAG: hypothetical protein DYG89_35285 [Caldilinea sp. CFX5]|nr:hypothetical protein [Caldilinea sp. CFX5]